MEDITIIYYTLNKLPKFWQEYSHKILKESAGNAPIISFSKEPIDLGDNYIQEEAPSKDNIYWQIFKGCKMTKTKFVALAEDDVLYPKEHFAYRPPDGYIAYNGNRWILRTWGTPFYFLKQWKGNCVAVADREMMVDAFTERFSYDPPMGFEVGVRRMERKYGLKQRPIAQFSTRVPVVQLYHKYSHNEQEANQRKQAKNIRVHDLPKWGKCEDILKIYEHQD